MHRFASTQWVPFPLDEVFAFFAAPENLPRLMPPALATRIEGIDPPPAAGTETGAAGMAIRLSFRAIPFLPMRLRWVARIVEAVPGSHFRDVQESGPFARFSHRHGFRAETRGVAGTLVSDEIEFELPLGRLGAMAAPLVRLQLSAAFAARRRRLPELLSGRG